MNGWLVHYNFFRPHESLGDRTPAEKAGIKAPFKDWMDVVKEGSPKISKGDEGESLAPKVYLPRASPKIRPQLKRSRKSKLKRQRTDSPVYAGLAEIRIPK